MIREIHFIVSTTRAHTRTHTHTHTHTHSKAQETTINVHKTIPFIILPIPHRKQPVTYSHTQSTNTPDKSFPVHHDCPEEKIRIMILTEPSPMAALLLSCCYQCPRLVNYYTTESVFVKEKNKSRKPTDRPLHDEKCPTRRPSKPWLP